MDTNDHIIDIKQSLGRIEAKLEAMESLEVRVQRLEVTRATFLGWLTATAAGSATGAAWISTLLGGHH